MQMKCSICNKESNPLFRAIVLGKHDVHYFSCSMFGFVQTESPYWLTEAYERPISITDIGLVGRNVSFSRFLTKLISFFIDGDGTFLDYGGGNGMLVRLMRDRGFDFRWHDKYAENLFANGLE